MKRELWDRRLYPLLIALNIFVNSLTLILIFGGRERQTICSRIGESMVKGGIAAHIPWPNWWIEHCVWAYEPERWN